ncbi:MAG: RNA polymerase sigma factor [Nitrospira sp.]
MGRQYCRTNIFPTIYTTMNLTCHDIEQLFFQHRLELTRCLYRIVRCEQTAADLCQETYMRLVSLGENTVVTYPRALLFRTATNLAIDYQRRRQHAAAAIEKEVPLDIPDPAPSAETVIWSKEQVQVLKEAITELPPKCRQVFILLKFDHLSHAEVASRLGITKGTVAKHMIKAVNHCKSRLQQSDR